MSNYTAREVNQAVAATSSEESWGDYIDGWDSFYQHNVGFSKELQFDEGPVIAEVAAKCTESDNSGYGEKIWIVLKVGDQYFRKSGYTSSYDSESWDGDCREVEPKQKTITVFE